MTLKVLDNVASGVEQSIITGGPVAAWITGGTVDVYHDGGVIWSLALLDRKLIDVGVDQILTFKATAASATCTVTAGSNATRRGYPRLTD